MDLIRLAVERKKNAKEALEFIIEMIEQYSQDACGGYENKNFFYHNSFLISDKKEAYVLETAGKFWVYKKLNSFYAISNGLTLENHYDNIHPSAIDFAKQKGWYKENEEFSFAKAFSDRFYTYFSKCEYRRKLNYKHLNKNSLNIQDFIEILQSHGMEENPLDKMESICLHSGGITTPSETTGSMIAILRNTIITVWLTGTSNPCLSLYKPFYFHTNTLTNFQEPSAKFDHSLWWRAEKIHRFLNFHNEIKKEYQKEIKKIQIEFIQFEKEILKNRKIQKKDLERFSLFCLQKENQLLSQWENEIIKYKRYKISMFIKRPLYTIYRMKLDNKAQIL